MRRRQWRLRPGRFSLEMVLPGRVGARLAGRVNGVWQSRSVSWWDYPPTLNNVKFQPPTAGIVYSVSCDVALNGIQCLARKIQFEHGTVTKILPV